MKSLLLIPLLLGSMPAMARDYSQSGGTQQTQCYENVYREEYVPGTRGNPGYVRRFNERVEVACRDQGYSGGVVPEQYTEPRADNNSCIEGSVLGALAGGAIGGAAATQENWIWSIPTGIVGGALVGCQLDGG